MLIVTLAWPSIRVTGSIVIFCATIFYLLSGSILMPLKFVALNFWFAPLSQLAQHVVDDVRIGRAAGYEDVHGDNFFQRAYTGRHGEFGIVWDHATGVGAFCFDVSPAQSFFNGKEIAHGRHAAKHGAVAQGYQYFTMAAHALSNFFIVRIIDPAFEDADVYAAFIGGLEIGDGSRPEIGQFLSL